MYYDENKNSNLLVIPLNIELHRNDKTIVQIHNDVNLENIVYCNDFLL